MKRREITVYLVLVSLFLVGYNPCLSEAIAKSEAKNNAARTKALAKLEQKLLKLKAGSTIQATKKAFGSQGMYLFTIQKNEHDYLCIRFSVGDNFDRDCVGYPYYSVFEDKKLYSIMEELPCNWAKKDEQGYWISDITPVDPNIIFSTRGLFGQDLVNSIRKNFPKEKCESNLPLPIPVLIIWYPASQLIESIMPKPSNSKGQVLPEDCNFK
ncbi:MAG: hypothetical protein JW806_02755 [Sedimentisphaerales bacterium]|nr:hypothetical protein [Sedimentisphaerales bacterium]